MPDLVREGWREFCLGGQLAQTQLHQILKAFLILNSIYILNTACIVEKYKIVHISSVGTFKSFEVLLSQ